MSRFSFRKARSSDLEHIVSLITDDAISSQRESLELASYEKALEEIITSSYTDIFLMENTEKEIVGCLQIMFLPHISRNGSKRAQVESVRVRSDLRSQGIGKQLMEYAIRQAKENGCKILQLTTDKRRLRAAKFYSSLGFEASHVGYKLFVQKDIETT